MKIIDLQRTPAWLSGALAPAVAGGSVGSGGAAGVLGLSPDESRQAGLRAQEGSAGEVLAPSELCETGVEGQIGGWAWRKQRGGGELAQLPFAGGRCAASGPVVLVARFGEQHAHRGDVLAGVLPHPGITGGSWKDF